MGAWGTGGGEGSGWQGLGSVTEVSPAVGWSKSCHTTSHHLTVFLQGTDNITVKTNSAHSSKVVGSVPLFGSLGACLFNLIPNHRTTIQLV